VGNKNWRHGKNEDPAIVQKQPAVDPLQAASNKLQMMKKLNCFGERQKVLQDWNEKEYAEDANEFWVHENSTNARNPTTDA
jgi:hypothetical protein